MPDRAVIYLRTARAEPGADGESPSITGQRRICQETAAALGAEVVAEFVDDGVSGATLDRPGLDACLARLDASPSVEYVVVTDISRLGRGVNRHSDTAVAVEVARLVTERGVTLHLAGDQRDYSGEDGPHSLLTALAQRRPSP